MNIAYFLIPKANVAFLYDDCTLRQGLEKMRHHGYTAIPVVSRDGKYIGTVSEGDFLWQILGAAAEDPEREISIKDTEKLLIHDIIKPGNCPPVRITFSVEELVHSAMNQNYVPVVDDTGVFIGIVTRKSIIRYLIGKDEDKPLPELLRKIVS